MAAAEQHIDPVHWVEQGESRDVVLSLMISDIHVSEPVKLPVGTNTVNELVREAPQQPRDPVPPLGHHVCLSCAGVLRRPSLMADESQLASVNPQVQPCLEGVLI